MHWLVVWQVAFRTEVHTLSLLCGTAIGQPMKNLCDVLWRGARQAIRTALNAQQSGDCGRIMIVLLTDGRANVSLAKSNEEPDACAEGAPRPSQARASTAYHRQLHDDVFNYVA